MKIMLRFTLITACLFTGNVLLSQSFSVSFPDTIVYGAAIDSSTLSCWNNDYVTNLTENPIELDVIRVQNDTGTPGWTSSFCFQFCSLPYVDSIRATLQPNEAVNIAVHFHVTGIPDTGTVVMMYRNVNDTSEVFYQRFTAITTPASVGPAINSTGGNVTCYPLPAIPQQEFKMNLEGEKFSGQDVTLNVYDVFGRIVAVQTGLHEGMNQIVLDVPAGMYTYSLSCGNILVHYGILQFVQE